jgi:hypothetical protein
MLPTPPCLLLCNNKPQQQNVMGHMAQLRKLMGVSDDMHKVRMSSRSAG